MVGHLARRTAQRARRVGHLGSRPAQAAQTAVRRAKTMLVALAAPATVGRLVPRPRGRTVLEGQVLPARTGARRLAHRARMASAGPPPPPPPARLAAVGQSLRGETEPGIRVGQVQLARTVRDVTGGPRAVVAGRAVTSGGTPAQKVPARRARGTGARVRRARGTGARVRRARGTGAPVRRARGTGAPVPRKMATGVPGPRAAR